MNGAAVAAVTATALVAGGATVVLLAGFVHLRTVRRGVDGHPDERRDASPAPGMRAVPAMALTALAVVGVRNLRGEDQAVLDTLFAACFLGMVLSSAWYLLSRRLPEPSHRIGVQVVSVAVALLFGACWALAGR